MLKKLMFQSLALCLFVGLTACGPDEEAEDVASLTGDSAAGQSKYDSNCAVCHGSDGKSGTQNIDIVEETKEHGDAATADVILNGKGSMPGFSGTLSDQDVADTIAYIKTL